MPAFCVSRSTPNVASGKPTMTPMTKTTSAMPNVSAVRPKPLARAPGLSFGGGGEAPSAPCSVTACPPAPRRYYPSAGGRQSPASAGLDPDRHRLEGRGAGARIDGGAAEHVGLRVVGERGAARQVEGGGGALHATGIGSDGDARAVGEPELGHVVAIEEDG